VRELAAVLAARGLQQLTVLSRPPGATLSIDGRDFGATPVTLELAPGVHRIALTHAGYTETTSSVELTRSDPLLVDVELTAPRGGTSGTAATRAPAIGAASSAAFTAPPSASAAAPDTAQERPMWPAWALFGASGIAFASAGVLEMLRHDAASEANSPDTSQVRFVEQSSSAETYQTGARVALGVGSVLALGGAFYWVGFGRKSAARATAALGCNAVGCSGGVRMTY